MLVDHKGRCIWPLDDGGGSRREISDLSQAYKRLQRFLPEPCSLTIEEVETQAAALLAEIAVDPTVSNLLNGRHEVILLPKDPQAYGYGNSFGHTYLGIVKNSCADAFDDHEFKFIVSHEGRITGCVTVVRGTRHDRVIATMAQRPVVAIYFPDAIPNVPITGAYEVVKRLSDNFALTGAIDTAMAIAMHPELVKVEKTFGKPFLDCGGVTWRDTDRTFSFQPDAGLDEITNRPVRRLTVTGRAFPADKRHSCGLVYGHWVRQP